MQANRLNKSQEEEENIQPKPLKYDWIWFSYFSTHHLKMISIWCWFCDYTSLVEIWLKFFNDNGGSAEKKRKTAGISYKKNGAYRHFLEI